MRRVHGFTYFLYNGFIWDMGHLVSSPNLLGVLKPPVYELLTQSIVDSPDSTLPLGACHSLFIFAHTIKNLDHDPVEQCKPYTGVTQLVVVLAVVLRVWAWQASLLSLAISDAPMASKSDPRSAIVPCMSVKNSVSGDMSLAVHFRPPDCPSANKQVDHL